MSRRTLLSALPATSLALALPVSADQADPIIPVYRKWCAARNEWLRLADLPGNGNWDSPETKRAEEKENVAFWKLIDMKPITKEGIAAMAHVLWVFDGPSAPEGHPDFPEQCEFPTNKLIKALWQAASGQDGLPL